MQRIDRIHSWRSALLQLSHFYSTHTSSPLLVASTIAHSISIRGEKLTALPQDVVAAVDASAATTNRKNVRIQGHKLTNTLKNMSRTKHRGGVQPNLYDEPIPYSTTRRLRGNRRQVEQRALRELSRHSPTPFVNEHDFPDDIFQGEDLKITQLLDAAAKEAGKAQTKSNVRALKMPQVSEDQLYPDETFALAYAATRFPGCYAALHRVFNELRLLAPKEWQPKSLLDFGAGPATATWAAQTVWWNNGNKHQIREITAVEPSVAMTWLGNVIQEHRKRRYDEWIEKKVNSQACVKDRDEDEDDDDPPVPPSNMRWLSRLPFTSKSRPAQVLKGSTTTTVGKQYDMVIAGYVLGELQSDAERRRVVMELWRRVGKYLVLVEPGTPAGSERILKARGEILDWENGETSRKSTGGAHVLGPCPHDGPCPLEERQSWCHFEQKFETTALNRYAKSIPQQPAAAVAAVGTLRGKGKISKEPTIPVRGPPRGHRDERFSYVILAKGPRPPRPQQVEVSGVVPVTPDEEWDEEQGVMKNVYLSIPENLQAKKVVEKAVDYYSDMEELLNFEDPEVEESSSSSSSDDEEDENSSSSSSDFNSSNSDQEDEVQDKQGSKRNDTRVEAQLRELLRDSLGGDDVDEEALEAQIELFIQSSREIDASEEPNNKKEKKRRKKEWKEVLPGDDSEYATTSTLIASTAWSRLLRPPRKRSGHVVMDICSAVGEREGTVLRQIVSKGKAVQSTGGLAPYKLARKVRWGDLWPFDYQKKMGATEAPRTRGSKRQKAGGGSEVDDEEDDDGGGWPSL